MKNLLRRILVLEGQQVRPQRLVCLWDDHDGNAQAEAAALKREHGDTVKVMVFGWLPEQPDNTEGQP